MGIELTTPMSQIDAYIQQQLERQEKKIIDMLDYIGTACINEARNNRGYIDKTGNLKTSTGYVIVKDGQILNGTAFDQTEGGQVGSEHTHALAAQYPSGIVLIVVAGMNYASYVEAMNLNVLTSAELLAEKMVPALLKELGF